MYLHAYLTGSRTAINSFQKIVADHVLFDDNIILSSMTDGDHTGVVCLIDNTVEAVMIAVNMRDACELIEGDVKFVVKLDEERNYLQLSLFLRGEE